MKFDLAAHATRRWKRPIALANIAPTQAQAGDLYALYLRIIAGWRERAAVIIAEYERTAADLMTDSASTTGSVLDGVAAEINRLILMLTPELRDWAVRVETVHRGKWVSSVLSATDINLNTILSPGDMNETIEAVINWNTALVRDVSEEVRRKIANSVFSGFQRRASATDIAKEISDTIGMARARARRIASDQTVKLGSRLNQARQEQAGITSFKWRHSGKAHPRSWHRARNGRIYSWDEPGIPADDMPGVPPYCGCTAQGVVTFGDE